MHPRLNPCSQTQSHIQQLGQVLNFVLTPSPTPGQMIEDSRGEGRNQAWRGKEVTP